MSNQISAESYFIEAVLDCFTELNAVDLYEQVEIGEEPSIDSMNTIYFYPFTEEDAYTILDTLDLEFELTTGIYNGDYFTYLIETYLGIERRYNFPMNK